MKAYKPNTTNKSLSIRYAIMSACLSAICHSVIISHFSYSMSYDRISMLIILFNVISVGAMGIISVFADRVENKHTGVRLAVLITVLGYYLPLSFGGNLKVVLLGLGSALYHSFASSSVLSRSNGKSRDIALLLGAQSIGLAFASFSGFFGHLFAPLLMIFAIPSDKYQKPELPEEMAETKLPPSLLPLAFLMLSYLLISYEFSSLSFPWNVWHKTQFELLLAIGVGRMLGGFISDRLGRIITVAASACGGTLLIYFCADDKRLSIAGLILLSMSLAPILTAVTRLMPNKPAFSFALASASAYLGQVLWGFIGFKSISLLLICAAVIAVTVAAELPFLPSGSKKEVGENEDN